MTNGEAKKRRSGAFSARLSGCGCPIGVGFLSFTLVLTLALWGAGLAGICGCLPFVGQLSLPATVGALGVIIGARISDTLVSHWGLYALGYRPNPGLKSTPLYVLEAVFIALTFWKGLSLAPGAAWTGIAVGAVFFVLVLPVMRALRTIRPLSARAPWISMAAAAGVDERVTSRLRGA